MIVCSYLFSDLPIIREVLKAADVLNSKWRVLYYSYTQAIHIFFANYTLKFFTSCVAEARRVGLYSHLRYSFWSGILFIFIDISACVN